MTLERTGSGAACCRWGKEVYVVCNEEADQTPVLVVVD
jgi:hypothetical protein